jgi:hypothetical protein
MQRYEVEVTDSFKNESTHLIDAKNISEARFIARNLHILEFKYKNDKLPVISSIAAVIGENNA